MTNNIIEKLNTHLTRGIEREADAVYLMVEIRKIIGRDKEISKNLYPTLKFYCDWVVHTEKDHITAEIEQIMTRIDKEYSLENKYPAFNSGSTSPTVSFIYMDELRKETQSFLSDFGLRQELITQNNWVSFVKILISILVDQPILNPINTIEYFLFAPAAPEATIWKIKFNDQRGEQRFANAF